MKIIKGIAAGVCMNGGGLIYEDSHLKKVLMVPKGSITLAEVTSFERDGLLGLEVSITFNAGQTCLEFEILSTNEEEIERQRREVGDWLTV